MTIKEAMLERHSVRNYQDKPEWFIEGVKMALLAPTAVNQQKFEIALKGDDFEIIDKGGILSKIDKGIVKYNFEIGAGKKNS